MISHNVWQYLIKMCDIILSINMKANIHEDYTNIINRKCTTVTQLQCILDIRDKQLITNVAA